MLLCRAVIKPFIPSAALMGGLCDTCTCINRRCSAGENLVLRKHKETLQLGNYCLSVLNKLLYVWKSIDPKLGLRKIIVD